MALAILANNKQCQTIEILRNDVDKKMICRPKSIFPCSIQTIYIKIRISYKSYIRFVHSIQLHICYISIIIIIIIVIVVVYWYKHEDFLSSPAIGFEQSTFNILFVDRVLLDHNHGDSIFQLKYTQILKVLGLDVFMHLWCNWDRWWRPTC